jgi:hypothetical protein
LPGMSKRPPELGQAAGDGIGALAKVREHGGSVVEER